MAFAIVYTLHVVTALIMCRDLFILIACDGVWDVMSNDEAVEFVAVRMGYISAHSTTTDCVPSAFSSGESTWLGLYKNASDEELQQAAAEATDALLAECLRKGSTDNLSALIILLKPPYYAYEIPPPASYEEGGKQVYARAANVRRAEGDTEEVNYRVDTSPMKAERLFE